VLDLWCAADIQCVEQIREARYKLPLLARFDTGAGVETYDWRCYSASALGPNGSYIPGHVAYCSRGQLANVLKICNRSMTGAATAASYPLPPNHDNAPPQSPDIPNTCRGDLSEPVPGTLTIMAAGDSAYEYRIPVVVGPFSGGHSETLMLFAEARLDDASDSGRHALAMSRSMDAGRLWEPVRHILTDANGTTPGQHVDGLNLGAAVYDARRQLVHVLYNECGHEYGVGATLCGPTAQLLLLTSSDHGDTFGRPRNLTTMMRSARFDLLNPGLSTGLQLASGRLVVPAWGVRTGKGLQDRAAAMLLSDGVLDSTLLIATDRLSVLTCCC
jgi:hypothetical protein